MGSWNLIAHNATEIVEFVIYCLSQRGGRYMSRSVNAVHINHIGGGGKGKKNHPRIVIDFFISYKNVDLLSIQ